MDVIKHIAERAVESVVPLIEQLDNYLSEQRTSIWIHGLCEDMGIDYKDLTDE